MWFRAQPRLAYLKLVDSRLIVGLNTRRGIHTQSLVNAEEGEGYR